MMVIRKKIFKQRIEIELNTLRVFMLIVWFVVLFVLPIVYFSLRQTAGTETSQVDPATETGTEAQVAGASTDSETERKALLADAIFTFSIISGILSVGSLYYLVNDGKLMPNINIKQGADNFWPDNN